MNDDERRAAMFAWKAEIAAGMTIIAEQMDVIAKAMEQIEDEVSAFEFRVQQANQMARSHPSNTVVGMQQKLAALYLGYGGDPRDLPVDLS